MDDPWEIVRMFERSVAEYAGAPYAVAVDSCTAALFLCCKRSNVLCVQVPRHTHISVPTAVLMAKGVPLFIDLEWEGTYPLAPYFIIDGACRFTSGMYQLETFHCLSFQYRKHLPIGRGGMILCDKKEDADWFKKARFFGREEKPLAYDNPAMLGWNLYMEPERAARGLTLLADLPKQNPDLIFDYPDLSLIEAFKCQQS